MIKKDKIILIFYIVFGFSLVGGILYVDSTFDKNNLPNVLPGEITELVIKRDLAIDKQLLFSTFQDVKNYPMILPLNILDVEIIDMTENIVITKSTIFERGMKSTMTLKHEFDPYNTYQIEVMDGDAKGTIVKLIFEGNSTQTNLTMNINLNLSGVISTFYFVPKEQIHHAADTVLDTFVLQSKSHVFDPYEKTVDEIYRSILFRPADSAGLSHYSTLLRENMVTVDQIKQEISESDEAKMALKPSDLKALDEISPNTISILDSLYEKILYRTADSEAVEVFGPLLEAGKMQPDEMEELLWNSLERKKHDRGELSYYMMTVFVFEEALLSSPDAPIRLVPFNKEMMTIDPRLINNINQGASNLEPETIDYVKKSFPEVFNQKSDGEECDPTMYSSRFCVHEIQYAFLQWFGVLLEEQKITKDDFRHEDGFLIICQCSMTTNKDILQKIIEISPDREAEEYFSMLYHKNNTADETVKGEIRQEILEALDKYNFEIFDEKEFERKYIFHDRQYILEKYVR